MSTFPLNFGPDGAGAGRFHRRASDECILEGGGWQFQSCDEKWFVSISERKIHQCTQSIVQCWRSRVQQATRFLLGLRCWFHDSGTHQNWQRKEDAFRKVGELVRKKTFIPVYMEDNIFNFLLEQIREIDRNQYCENLSAAGKRVWQSSALVSPTKTLNTDLVPLGDDIEPIEALREDVGMGNEEDEEPVESPDHEVRHAKLCETERCRHLGARFCKSCQHGQLRATTQRISITAHQHSQQPTTGNQQQPQTQTATPPPTRPQQQPSTFNNTYTFTRTATPPATATTATTAATRNTKKQQQQLSHKLRPRTHPLPYRCPRLPTEKVPGSSNNTSNKK